MTHPIRQTANTPSRYIGLLESIGLLANDAANPVDALGAALGQICAATGWPVGHALTRAVDREALISTGLWHIDHGIDSPELQAFRHDSNERRFARGMGLPGRVDAQCRPVWIDNARIVDNYPRQARAAAAGLGGCFGFPVIVDHAVVAVLEFYSATPEPLRDDLLEIMGNVGIQLGRVFEREIARAALASSEQRTRQILDSAAVAFIGIDDNERITSWNSAAETVFGWKRDEALGRSIAETIIPPAFRDAHHRGMTRFLTTGKGTVLGQRLELPALYRDGREFPIEITLWSLADGDRYSFYAFAHDISERKETERQLRHQALHDELTGLANRALLLDRLEQLLVDRSEIPELALLFVDLDHFKRINDSFGHDAGDRVLTTVADRLNETVRPVDTVARLSGDEFVVLCPGIASHRDAAVVAQRLLQSLSKPIRLSQDSVFLSASIGVALADADSDADSLLSAADTAMYEAKTGGRGHYELFDRGMQIQVTKRLQIESELRCALDNQEFQLHFQPIVDSEGRIASAEALLRWQHPQHGMILPGDFISVAEETGLIVPIGIWVLEEACRLAREWQSMYSALPPLGVSVNLSGRQLAQSDLVGRVQAILQAAAVDPGRIQFGLEVTETVVMRDPETAADTLGALKALGVYLSIDDFGTGYSSLAYLKRFPVDTVKVDRSFITSIDCDPTDQAIVRSVTELAHTLDLTLVAEGVETMEQAAALRDIGVDYHQGFLYARPLPPEQFLSRLHKAGEHR